MPVLSTPHLVRRGHVFYFRRALPSRLIARFGRRELKFSLGTRDSYRARIRCRMFANRFDAMAAVVERMPYLDQKHIEGIVRGYFSDLLAQTEERVWMFRNDDTVNIEDEIHAAEHLQGRVQAQIAAGHLDNADPDVDELLGPHSDKPDLEGLDVLRQGILRARAESLRIAAAMLRGAYDDIRPKDPLFEGVKSPGLPPLPLLPGEKPAEAALSVSALVGKYCSLKASQDWVPKTADENRRVLGWFQGHVGSTRKITELSVEDVREFRDLILRLPKGFSTKAAFKDKTLDQIAAMKPDGDRLGAATLQKYFGCVKWFLQWCEDEGYIDASPARKVRIGKKVNLYDARDPFTKEQLQTLFQSPMFTGHRSASRRSSPGAMVVRDGKYWIPLIGLFSGMRLGEIVQLMVADLRTADGIAYFDVNKDEGAGKVLKTKASARTIPVHDELVRIGFLAFVDARRKKEPGGRLFPDIQPGKNGYFSHNISKFFGRYLDQVGVKSSKVAFHSFRHNFADALRAGKIEDSHIKALMGHADTSTTAIYGWGVPLKVLRDDMAKVSYEVDLGHLYA